MMRRLWERIRELDLDQLLFLVLVFCLPLQKRHVFVRPESVIAGAFNEWTSMFLYVTDILVAAVLVAWVVRCVRLRAWPRVFGVNWLNGALGVLVACAALSAALGAFPAYRVQSWYHVAKLVEFAALFLYVAERMVTSSLKRWMVAALLFSASLQSLISVAQYKLQQSVGLKFFGEIDLAPQIQNIAKVVVSQSPLQVVIRPTALFPHANVLGGFMAIVVLLGLGLLADELVRGGRKIYSALVASGILLSSAALAYSFSRSAWVGFVVGLGVFVGLSWWWARARCAQLLSMLKDIKVIVVIVAVCIALLAFAPQALHRGLDNNQFDTYSTQGRVLYAKISSNLLAHHLLFGVGPGNFTPALTTASSTPLAAWQYQPVHIVLLLVATEYGLLAAIALIVCMLRSVKRAVQRARLEKEFLNFALVGALMACGAISLFDHYLFTIQQGALLTFILLGLASSRLRS